jgi:CPA2 family monovalent cation:H+ antiporter-2
VLTSPIVVFVAERAGFSARPALESGLLLSQTSELSLVVVLQGMVFGQIDAQVFTVVAITTALTMLLTPVIATEPVTRWLLRFHPMRREAHVRREPRDHVVLIGCGAAGMPLLETLLAGGHDVVVVDDDPAVVDRLREGGVPSIRGDALDPGVLRDAGIAAARIITSTVRRPQDNRLLLETVRDVPVLVRVFEDDEATWVRSMGGRPVVSAEAAATAFFRWYDEYQRGDEENDNFNTEFAEKHGTENDM